LLLETMFMLQDLIMELQSIGSMEVP